MTNSLPRIALVWSQFAPYHSDRCEAVGRRLAGRAEVVAVEVASASETYDWTPSGAVAGVTKHTLFAGQSFDAVGRWAKFRAMWVVLRGCQQVYIGIPYSAPEVIMLSWLLRLWGVHVVMMTDSKFDDMERSVWFEACKSLLLCAYRAAVVAGRRQVRYLRFLGFRTRPVLLGYDVVSVDRIRAQALAARDGPGLAMAERDFLFVGRFVPKKRLLHLIDAYAGYVARVGDGARGLVLVGSGPEEPVMRARLADLGLSKRVVFAGFLQDAAIAAAMDRALALLLVSVEEQWGLVVNEALAVGVPVIVSAQAGSTDLLVRNLVNGFAVQPDDKDSLIEAMYRIASDPMTWAAMAEQSHALAWKGDCERFADAVEILLTPGAEPAASRYRAFEEAVLSVH